MTTTKEPLPRPFDWKTDIINISLSKTIASLSIGTSPLFFAISVYKHNAWPDRENGTNYVGLEIAAGRPKWGLQAEIVLWNCKDHMTFKQYYEKQYLTSHKKYERQRKN